MTSSLPQAVYDVCIVGAGMIGSSAARHAVEMIPKAGGTLSVCLIGPDEPKDRGSQSVLSSYYDEARITRSTASDVVWATLANRSIVRYRQLERMTGIHFYEEVGCLTASEKKADLVCDRRQPRAHVGNYAPGQLNDTEMRSQFPYLYSTRRAAAAAVDLSTAADAAASVGDAAGVYEVAEAGYINPRRICQAQQAAAVAGGCHVIRDVVADVTEVRLEEAVVERVRTKGGLVLHARQVLLSTGAFTEFNNLLPGGFPPLDLQPITQSVIFVQLSPEDAVRLKHMPSMLLISSSDAADNNECYVLPPVKYPDGKVYVKLGHGVQCERDLKSPAEIIDWYCGPVPADDQATLSRVFAYTFPDIKPVSVHYDTCVTTNTPSGRPYIDRLTPRLGVALGGNGCAAKCCDEIGRLAVHLLVSGGQWTDTELSREMFTVSFKPKSSL